MTPRTRIVAVLFLANVAIAAYAGYAVGIAKGRGWRAAVIGHGCTLACPLADVPRGSTPTPRGL